MGNCEEQLTSTDCRPTDNQQFTDRSPTGHRQVTDRSPTGYQQSAKILERKNTLLKPMSKPTKLNKSEKQKAKKLTKSEEQLIVNPDVWINMEKKTSSEDQAFEKDVWIKM